MTFSRTRGDSHPIVATIKVDGIAIDLTGSIVKFSYKSDAEVAKTITGTPLATIGEIEFVPSATDFQVEGVYTFDIQREANSYISTHLKGVMLLEGDVTV
jgi:hypothetical protein